MKCPHCGEEVGRPPKRQFIGRCEAITERKWWNIEIKDYDYQ